MESTHNGLKRLMDSIFQALLRLLTGGSSDKTHLEVERKFRIDAEEAATLPEKLTALGLTAGEAVDMTDTFLPARVEGDMVRLRTESDGRHSRTLLTLKSWVRTPDGGRERKETEGQVRPLARSILLFLGRRLSGADLLSFSKHRRHFLGHLSGRDAVVSIDTVEGLGEFSGLYLEVEMLVPVGEDVQSVRKEIFALVAEVLGKDREQVSMSYIDMLKRSRGLS